MKRILLVALALVFMGSSLAMAGEGLQVGGFMKPNFRLIDKGEGHSANMGFGMNNNRVTFKGAIAGGDIVKKIAWRVETGIPQNGMQNLQWAYVEPCFSDNFSVRLGRVKQAFSGENLWSTAKLLTVERHFVSELKDLKYAGYAYAMEAHMKQEKFNVQAGLYDGTGNTMHVENQDPKITVAARATVTATEGLDVSANVALVPLMDNHFDGVTYSDSAETNTGIAFGADAKFSKALGEGHLTLAAEFDTGDNWSAGAKDPGTGDTFEDYSWHKFQYMLVRGLYMVNSDFGIHFGFSQWDPNTDTDEDAWTMITPGVTYYWSKNLWTMVEVQMESYGMGKGVDSVDYTHFVLQSVFLWP